jgi:hypothetical protein
VKIVEGVKETLLRLLFIGNELYVIYKQYIGTAVLISEVVGFPLPDGIDELVGELLTGYVYNVCVVSCNHMSYGMQQMAFAQPHTSVDEQRVVTLPRILGNAQGGGVSQPVAGAYDEAVKSVFWAQQQVAVCFCIVGVRDAIAVVIARLWCDADPRLQHLKLDVDFVAGNRQQRFSYH